MLRRGCPSRSMLASRCPACSSQARAAAAAFALLTSTSGSPTVSPPQAAGGPEAARGRAAAAARAGRAGQGRARLLGPHGAHAGCHRALGRPRRRRQAPRRGRAGREVARVMQRGCARELAARLHAVRLFFSIVGCWYRLKSGSHYVVTSRLVLCLPVRAALQRRGCAELRASVAKSHSGLGIDLCLRE